jgi:hypothetical protein
MNVGIRRPKVAQVGLLNCIFGVLQRTEHPVGDPDQMVAVPFELDR